MAGSPPSAQLQATFPPPAVGDAIVDMVEHGPTAAAFATVSDFAILRGGPHGIEPHRAFTENEAYTDHLRQLSVIDHITSSTDLRLALNADDVRRAHQLERTVILGSVEGGDFIDYDLARISEAYTRGIRGITLVHYSPNQIGSPQTMTDGQGLSPFGVDVVRHMNRTGLLIDLSHADIATTEGVVRESALPCILSHTNLRFGGHVHPRLVPPEHARLVTEAGGVVGAVAAGFGQSTLDDYIDTILAMVDILGVEHVAIGTDINFTFRPVLHDYSSWPIIPGELLTRGMTEDEVAQVLGGNVLRLLEEVVTPARDTGIT